MAVRPLFAGLRSDHHPATKLWSFYIAWLLLSSNSAPRARMLLLWKIFAPGFASSAAKLRIAQKEFCSWSDMGCIPGKSADLLRRAGS